MVATLRRLLIAGALLFVVLALIMAAQPAPVRAEPRADDITYVVQPGDRLVDIAARYGVSASAIVRTNGLANADTIYPGQRLIIPGTSVTPTGVRATGAPATAPAGSAQTTRVPNGASASSTAAGQSTTYTVQLGDTLATIARSFGISAAALAQANDITNSDLIWVGQKLIVPVSGGDGNRAQPQASVTPIPVPLPSTSLVAPAAQPAATAVPTATAAAPVPEATAGPARATAAGPKIHVVQAGETLSAIARKYGVSVGDLVAANGLGSPDVIRVGVRLLIPAQSGTASDGSATSALGKPTKFVASISQQRCWLYNGETVIARWICSTGRSGSPSVPGAYKIQSKMPKAYGSTWDIWMPFWLGIYWAGGSENGIHGLPWNAKTGVQIWSGNVGKPITFGCIMLDNINAKMLYDAAWIGMPVVILP